MWEELENALAWYAAAPVRWVSSAKKDLSAAAEWVWVVIQGDFADEQTVAQTVTGTIISMIPLVDQICDVRDVVANCRKINQDTSNKWAWFALVLTLIGLFPTLGSLAKGCFKVLFAYGRKAMFSAGKVALDADLWKASKPFVEAGVKKLNDFMARPEVRKALASLKIDNPYKYLADKLRELSGSISLSKLTQAFDAAIGALNKLLDLVKKWGTAAMQTRAGELLQSVKKVRDLANAKLAEVLAPVQGWLDKLAKRLELETKAKYHASTNVPNVHGSQRLALDAEIEELKRAPPAWVKVTQKGEFDALKKAPPVPAGHFDIGTTANNRAAGSFSTFHKATSDVLPPGTVIYRVIDPSSVDNSICWMTKSEFDKLTGKTDWRQRFAVWMNWNANGQYVKYTVPPGRGLPVWRGTTASQRLERKNGEAVVADAHGNNFWIEGGAEQIVVNPGDLKREFMSARQATGWATDGADIDVKLVGVPDLQTIWK